MTLNKVSAPGARSPDRLLYRLSRDSPMSRANWLMPRARDVTQGSGQQRGVFVVQHGLQIGRDVGLVAQVFGGVKRAGLDACLAHVTASASSTLGRFSNQDLG